MNYRVVEISHDCIYWYCNNAFHRKNSPARIFSDGREEWWVNAERIK